MTKLLQKYFRGISMKAVNNYIETINEYLNEGIRKGANWTSAVKNLSTYLNEHDFVQHEGIAINDDTIDEFITRIKTENNNDNLNFLPVNKLEVQPMSKPQVFQSNVLDQYRNSYSNGLRNQQFATRNLSNDLGKIHAYSEFFKERGSPFPKKEKKQKIGKLGMDQLTQIVLDLNQDVKQIKDAQSLEGAQAWVQKHGPELYHVEDADINGDNIPDIIVKNKEGKNVIVNGYTTGDSTYPYRYSYYTEYPTAEKRKEARQSGVTFREHIKGLYNSQYDDYGIKIQRDSSGNPLFANKEGMKFEAAMKRAGYEKIMRPKDKTPYQAFVTGVVKPLYDVVKKINSILGKSTQSQLLTKVAATIWNQTILLPAMVYVYGNEVLQVSDSDWKKLRNKGEVKNAILQYVQFYLGSSKNLLSFIPLFIEVCNKSDNPIPQEFEQWIPRFLKARLLNKSIPGINDEEGWAKIEAEFDKQFP